MQSTNSQENMLEQIMLENMDMYMLHDHMLKQSIKCDNNKNVKMLLINVDLNKFKSKNLQMALLWCAQNCELELFTKIFYHKNRGSVIISNDLPSFLKMFRPTEFQPHIDLVIDHVCDHKMKDFIDVLVKSKELTENMSQSKLLGIICKESYIDTLKYIITTHDIKGINSMAVAECIDIDNESARYEMLMMLLKNLDRIVGDWKPIIEIVMKYNDKKMFKQVRVYLNNTPKAQVDWFDALSTCVSNGNMVGVKMIMTNHKECKINNMDKYKNIIAKAIDEEQHEISCKLSKYIKKYDLAAGLNMFNPNDSNMTASEMNDILEKVRSLLTDDDSSEMSNQQSRLLAMIMSDKILDTMIETDEDKSRSTERKEQISKCLKDFGL